MALIGVDIGTQGTKTALYDHDGVLLAQAFESSELKEPGPGMVEEDPDRQVMSVCRTVKECLENSQVRPAEIEGIAIDGQMAGVIGIDDRGHAVTPYDSWLDTRCAPYIDSMKAKAGHEITALTGCAPSFNHGPKILFWQSEHPATFERTTAFVQPGGYAAIKLCGLSGEDAFIDRSYLHFSGFANNLAGSWSEDLCRAFGVPVEKLPRIVASHEIVGQVTTEMEKISGLAAGTPVAAGCGDTAASFLSCGATRDGVCVDVAGTASVFAATTTEFRADTKSSVLGCGCAVAQGLWHPYAYINGGGMNLEWFRKILAGTLPDTQSLNLDQLDELAGQSTDVSDLPYFVPHLAGRVMPPMPQLRGAWVGLRWSHSIGDLYRAILEGVAFEYEIYRSVLIDLYPDYTPRELRVTGGGEKSAVWNAIKASVLNMPVVSINGGGGAPMGSALLAGYATGVFDDLPTASERWVRTGLGENPRSDLRDAYRRRAPGYEALLEILNRFQEDIHV